MNEMTNNNNIEQENLMQLMGKVSIGDRAAFKDLYDKTSRRAYSVALKMLGNTTAAQDLIQEAYIKVWSNAQEYRPDKGNVISWLLAIVRYRALDAMRSKQRHDVAMNNHQTEIGLSSLVSVDAKDSGITHCLSTLAETQRESIVQAFVFGWTYEELADKIALPVSTVKSRIRRGLAKLKECLER